MEVKKKFEKPQMEVVQLEPAGIMSGSNAGGCTRDWVCFGAEECNDCEQDCLSYGPY